MTNLRTISDIEPRDFSSDFDSGSLVGLTKTGAGRFSFELQSREVYGPQGSLTVWFYGRCRLGDVHIGDEEAIHFTVRPPHRLDKMRPVYSHNNENWHYVRQPYGSKDDGFDFDVPLRRGLKSASFAAHFPYPSTRMIGLVNRALESKRVACGSIGNTELGREITFLTIADPYAPATATRSILLSAGSHAGETASLWGTEGIVEFLTSQDPEATEMLRDTVFYVLPMLNVDGAALGLDRRNATGVNIYFDYREFRSSESRAMWKLIDRLRPSFWLDLHSWHLGVAEGAYGPDPGVIGDARYDSDIRPLRDAVGMHFPINEWGADTLDCPNTQALLQFGIPGLCPEFNMGLGANGQWKNCQDNMELGVNLLRGALGVPL